MSLKVENIDEFNPNANLDLYKIHEVMVSDKYTTDEKLKYIKKHHLNISNLIDKKITGKDFKRIMKSRPLVIYRPLYNSYTKAIDKKLLAMALGIPQKNVNGYIKKLSEGIHSMRELDAIHVSKDNYDEVKFYIFRHGTKEQALDFLNYELAHSKHILVMLYHILEYNSGGIADYFLRPIHRLDNKTMLEMYNIIHKNLKLYQSEGKITDAEERETAEWALARIYEIKNNQQFKNAIKLKEELELETYTKKSPF